MEPNPFEQSFLGMSSEQQAAAAAASANEGVTGAVTTTATGASSEGSSKPVLPPIESMSGRLAAAGSDQYGGGWDAQSLRMGPLSPSMLEGPQNSVVVVTNVATAAPVSTVAFTSAGGMTTQIMPTTVVDNGFPFMATTQAMATQVIGAPIQASAAPYPQNMYNQAIPMQQQQQHHQQQPHGASRPGPQHPQYAAHPNAHGPAPPMHDRYMPPQNEHNGDAFSNLHLLSQATQREMWIKRESMDAAAHPNQHMQQQQQHHHHHQQQQQQQQQQQHPQQHHVQNGQGMAGMTAVQKALRDGVDQGLSRGVRKVGLESEDNNSDDSDRSRQSSEGAANNSGNNKKRPASEDKMDDEEKRRNFLERNRQAALKCRQRKKQWLSNLQAKVEYLSTDNEHLQNQTAALRDEIIHLKALLLAHKDCPVAQANGVYAETISIPPNGIANSARGGAMPANTAGSLQQPNNIRNNSMNGQRGGALPAHAPPPPQMQTGGGGMGLAVGGHPNIHGQAQASVRY
ncbi:hypothetical protein BGZ83_009055 [Gryganskiella cystojenkinii]|nr:hypothetical protein BGZ83_009055 [Gryganskiella cystojenkinii]